MDKKAYRRLNLKNGWDLPEGEKPPLTGPRQESARAYELLVKKTDEEYIQEAQIARKEREIAETKKRISILREAIGLEKANPGSISGAAGYEPRPKKVADVDEKPYENEIRGTDKARRARGRKIKLIILLAVLTALVLAAGGRLLFGPPILMANISSYEDVEIIIEGLKEEPFTITVSELADMKLDTMNVDVHEVELLPDEEPESGKAIGPTLDTFLAHYGYNTDDIRSMKVYNGKDVSKAYVHTLKDSKIILSVANGRKRLNKNDAPLRIAVSDAEAGEWPGWIRRIVFTMK